MLKLDDIEGKTIRLYLSHLNYERERSKYEFCFFYLDVYFTTNLIFVIVDPGRDKVEHILEIPEELSIIIDRATENRRKNFLFGKCRINQYIKWHLEQKLMSKNNIISEEEYYSVYKNKKEPFISRETLKGCLTFIILYIVMVILVILYHLIFK